MKQFLTKTVLAFCLVASASAQEFLTFTAGTTRRIQFSPDGVTVVPLAVGNPAQVPGFGMLNIAFYSAPSGTVLSMVAGIPDLSSWFVQTSAPIHRIGPIPGIVPGTAMTLSPNVGVPGGYVQVEAVGWSGNYSDFMSAAQSGNSVLAWSGSAFSGGALGWTQRTGTATLPQVTVTGAGGFNGLVFAPAPEPSTMVLGGLGALAMMVVRRCRKI